MPCWWPILISRASACTKPICLWSMLLLTALGTVKPAIHRYRRLERPNVSNWAKERMPSASVEAATYARDGWRCRFCNVRVMLPAARRAIWAMLPGAIGWGSSNVNHHAAFFALTATIDHLLPHSAGGTSDPHNLVTACWPCNFGHGDRLLEEVGLIDPRTHSPTNDEWNGLSRMLRLAKAAPCTAFAAPRAEPPLKPAGHLSDDQWVAELDRIEPSISRRFPEARRDNCEGDTGRHRLLDTEDVGYTQAREAIGEHPGTAGSVHVRPCGPGRSHCGAQEP